jgi:hypothetical protein
MNKMKRSYKKMIRMSLCVSFLLFLVFPAYEFVKAETQKYTVLAPLPGTTIDGSKTDLATYLPGLIRWSIGLAAAMAVVMITFGGIMYATTDAIYEKEDGKKYIEDALWGLILVIGAWVILNTINPQILILNLNPGPIGPFDEVTGSGLVTDNVRGRNALEATDAQVAENSKVVRTLKDGGVSVNTWKACSADTTTPQRGCTSVYGLPQKAVDGLIAIKKDCGCNITVTGGTEYHGPVPNQAETHKPGNAVVDLDVDTNLSKYLEKFDEKALNPTSNLKVTTSNAVYTYENTGDNGLSTAPHWHVVFK